MTEVEKLLALLKAKSTNRSQLASEMGYNKQTVYSALERNKGLSYAFVRDACNALGVSLSEFEGERAADRQKGGVETAILARTILDQALDTARRSRVVTLDDRGISVDDVLNWHHQHSGRMENFDKLAPFADLFRPPAPDANIVDTMRLGPKGLASTCFQVETAEEMTNVFKGFSKPLNQQIVAAHLDALKRGEPVISHPKLDEKLPDGSRFIGSYRRVLAPIYDGNQALLINFAQQLPHQPLLLLPPAGQQPAT